MCSCDSTHHFISFVTMADPPDAAQAASAVTAQGASDQMEAAVRTMAADEQNEVSEVESGLSESEGSGVSATTRLTRSSFPASRKVKKQVLKKKDTSKRKDGVKDCWACKSTSANLDELQEYWRRKLNSENLGEKKRRSSRRSVNAGAEFRRTTATQVASSVTTADGQSGPVPDIQR